jgi:hypothetical protein
VPPEEDVAAKTFELTLADFAFPRTLPDSRANFRLVVDVRLVNKSGAFATAHVVMPGLDTFWECDKDRAREPNFVRGADEGRELSTIDMTRVDDWERLILLVKAERIHSVQVVAFDVNREDVWNRLKDVVGQIVRVVLGSSKTLLGQVPDRISDYVGANALGTAADDLESHILKRLANGDRILYRGAAMAQAGTLEIAGRGTGGKYRVRVEVREVIGDV